jgi:hypothetical protein
MPSLPNIPFPFRCPSSPPLNLILVLILPFFAFSIYHMISRSALKLLL